MKPEDAMYEILPLIGQQYDDIEEERLIKKVDKESYKTKILDYINNELTENYSLFDIFQNSNVKHGGLTYLGYKLLKDKYEFHSTTMKFGSSMKEYMSLSRHLKGLFYATKLNKNFEVTIHSTDEYTINIIILSGGDFKTFCNMLDN
jgi:hypothetical protein